MDDIDTKLLTLLQQDAARSHNELAQAVGLSAAGIHKRLKRLHQDGIIKRTVAIIDRQKVGLDLMCFLKVNFKNNLIPANLDELRQAMQRLPEVLECYTLTGTSDAILKIAVANHVALREFLVRLSEAQQAIDRVETCIVLEEFREGAELPLRGPA